MIDIGANLTDKSFNDDIDAVLSRARRNDVEHIIVTGTDLAVSEQARHLARSKPGYLSYTAGIHPHHADEAPDGWTDQLIEIADGAVAIGETGLDYFRNFSSRDGQRRIFRSHLELAQRLDMPLFIHDRDSGTDLFELLSEFDGLRGVVHCFTGTEEQLKQYLELGYYIGVTGWICDERRGLPLRDAVRLIPDERILIETDAPYLLPRTIRPRPRSRRNEPANLRYVAETTASARGQSVEELEQITVENSRRLFGL